MVGWGRGVVSRAAGPGAGSVRGLRWLASVGPAPVAAWATAMGWAMPTAYPHAARLQSMGWVERCAMTQGEGSLLYATRAGVEMSGVVAVPLAGVPAPATWGHWVACAWTAAWLSARGRELVGAREVLLDEFWRGEVSWSERGGVRRRGHRPDLAAGLSPDGPLLPIEVELASKSMVRLRAILGLHAAWIAAGKTAAVIYVCGGERVAARVREQAAQVGLGVERRTLRVELLETVRAQALAAREAT